MTIEQNGLALEERLNPQIDQDIRALFSEQDNTNAFRVLLETAGSNRHVLDALIVARFKRAHYLNGSVPQEYQDPKSDIDKELIRLAGEVDTETIENENVKLAYKLLNVSVNMHESDQSGMHALAPVPAGMPTSILLSETLYVSSPETTTTIMEQVEFGLVMASKNNQYTTKDLWEQQAIVLAALPEKISFTADSATSDIEILSYAMNIISAMDARINGTELEGPAVCSSATKQDFEIFKNGFNEIFMRVAKDGFGLSEEAATVALNVFTPHQPFSFSSVSGLFSYSKDKDKNVLRLMESFKSPLAKDLFEKQIKEIVPENDGQKSTLERSNDFRLREILQKGVVEYISMSSDPSVTLERIHDMFKDPLLSEYMGALKLVGLSDQLVGHLLGNFSLHSDWVEDSQLAFFKNRDHVEEVINDLVVEGIINKLKSIHLHGEDDGVVRRENKLKRLLSDILSHEELIGTIRYYRESGAFVDMLSDYDNMSAFIVVGSGHMTDLFAGIEKTLNEYYKRIRNATSNEEVLHYSNNISDLFSSMKSFDRKETVRQSYKDFIGSNALSAKEEQRSLRLFINLASVVDEGEHVPDFDSVDEIEVFIFERTLKNVGIEGGMSPEQFNTIKEAFGGDIQPISTYIRKFCGDERYRQVFRGMLESIASGNFKDWKYGFTEEGGFEQMKASGYIPANLSLDQYMAWIKGSATSTESELEASAEDVSNEIYRAIQLASVDLSMVAPGFEITEGYANMLREARSAFGKTIGVLHRYRGMKEDYVEEQLIEELSKIIGVNRHPFLDFVKHRITEEGAGIEHKIEVVEKYLSKADKLINLIRITNLRPREILEGSLLTDEGKRQKELSIVLSEMKTELPEEVAFIFDTVERLLDGYQNMHAGKTKLEVMDTDNPKITIEIGEKPLRSCQHYASGGYNSGLVGYFGPDVKIIAAFNESGNIVGRAIVRLMQDQNGDPVLYAEPTYISIPSRSLSDKMSEHLKLMSERMGGIRYGGALGSSREPNTKNEEIKIVLKMPAAYSDGARGINKDNLTLTI